MSEIKKIYYVSSTHWDREWHRSFQSFRFALVNRINEIMDVLDKDPSFTSFIMDGQTTVSYTHLDVYKRQGVPIVAAGVHTARVARGELALGLL